MRKTKRNCDPTPPQGNTAANDEARNFSKKRKTKNNLTIVDADNFADWMAHETFAETRRRAFVKSRGIDAIFRDLSAFALTARPSCDEPETPFAKREMFALHKHNVW